jgi:hypothetical protein
MGWVKYLAIALAAIATSFSTATITATNAVANCKGCSAPVVSRSTRHVRGGTTVRRSKAVRRTSSTRTKRVRRVTTTVRTRYVQPVRHVRTIHTVHHRRVVYHQRRTVNRTVVRPTRVVHSHSVRHVNLGTVHVNMNCNRCN